MFEGRRVVVPGEALFRVGDGPDFVVFGDCLKSWDYPEEEEPLTDADRSRLLRALTESARQSGLRLDLG